MHLFPAIGFAEGLINETRSGSAMRTGGEVLVLIVLGL